MAAKLEPFYEFSYSPSSWVGGCRVSFITLATGLIGCGGATIGFSGSIVQRPPISGFRDGSSELGHLCYIGVWGRIAPISHPWGYPTY